MKNRVIKINERETCKILSNATPDTFIAEIDGSEISDTDDLFDKFASAFGFRISGSEWSKNWAAFDDMMTDLDWLPQSKIVLVIRHYDSLLLNKPYEKKRLISYLNDSILPFWEHDVLDVTVDGKMRGFTVYLTD